METEAALTNVKSEGKAKKYCSKMAELCFPLIFAEDAVHEGRIISYPKGSVSGTVPAAKFIIDK